ncbi:MAG: hypothetical protein AAF628_21240 [Planctomycetota bacterium]
MTVSVDFLPAAYREGQQRVRRRRERTWLAVLVLVGVGATEALFRHREFGIRQMVENAERHASAAEGRARAVVADEQRLVDLAATLRLWTAPLAAARVPEVVGALLGERTEGVRFAELECRVDPWLGEPKPWLRVHATCTNLDELSRYLAVVQAQGQVPRLRCRQAQAAEEQDGVSYLLETEEGAR